MGNRIFEAKSQNDNKVEFTEFSPYIGICENPGIRSSYHLSVILSQKCYSTLKNKNFEISREST